MLKPTRFLAVAVLGATAVLAAQAQQPRPRKSPTVAAILKLADTLETADVPARARQIVEELDACDMPVIFTKVQRGGAGIGSAAQAGHPDSIEGLVGDWAGKKPPTKQELTAHQKDLIRTARILQVMAELAPYRVHIYVPKHDAPNTERWFRVSADFKEVARDFRAAIESTDPTRTRAAAVRLQRTCHACHGVAGV